ncbi:MAG: hypothetical protein KDF65_14280, partial [Anaerolineae bacterium]|nr:hypothetical protein [Anaerolineae bacterium]
MGGGQLTTRSFRLLEEAWPELRKLIRTRLRWGYCLKQPAAYRGKGPEAQEPILKSNQQQLNEAGRQQWNRKAAFWDALPGAEGNDFHRYLIG